MGSEPLMLVNQYVEIRDGAYFVAGTRIGLDVVTYEFRDGQSPEDIFDSYPSIGSLAKMYGTITFILEHPKEIEEYLRDQDRRYEDLKIRYPLTDSMLERFGRGRSESLARRFDYAQTLGSVYRAS